VTLIDAIVAGSQQIDGVFRAALDAQNRVKDLESRLDSLEGRIHRLEAGGTPPGSP
jgi:hypothetical protein